MRFPCPCCGYKTFLHEPKGHYDVCEVCGWEDDPIQLNDPDYEGGANSINFQQFGACEATMVKRVRQPTPEEARDKDWEPLKSV
jgi:hypothetical protein